MSTFSKAPFRRAPFLRDLNHWNKVLDADLLKPIADEVAQKADVMLVGYAGAVRNIFAVSFGPQPGRDEELKVRARRSGAAPSPRWACAHGIAYNDLQRDPEGVIAAGENEPRASRP